MFKYLISSLRFNTLFFFFFFKEKGSYAQVKNDSELRKS